MSAALLAFITGLVLALRRRATEAPVLGMLLLGLVAANGLSDFLRGGKVTDVVLGGEGGSLSLFGHSPVATLLAPVILAMVLWHLVVGPMRARGGRSLALLFMAALIGGLASAYMGYRAGLNGWTSPLRIVAVASAYFWAQITLGGYELSRLRASSVGLCAALCAGVIAVGAPISHAAFPMAASAGAGTAYLWFGSQKAAALPGFVAMVFMVATASLTVSAVAVFAVVLVATSVPSKRKKIISPLTSTVGVVILGSLMLALSTGVIQDYGRTELAGSIDHLQRINDKVFRDRAPLWSAAVDDILARPWIAPPARQDFAAPFHLQPWAPLVTWVNGAHNVWLELARHFGLLGAVPIALLFIVMILRSVGGLPGLRPPAQIVVAVAVSTLAIGWVAGNYPIYEAIGIPLWGALGFFSRRGSVAPETGGVSQQGYVQGAGSLRFVAQGLSP